MNGQTRKKAMLGLLLLALAVVVWRQLSGGGSGAAGASPGRGRARGRADSAVTEVLAFDVTRLVAERAVYSPGRDPFRYGPAPPPPAPPAPPPSAVRPAAERRAATAAAERARPQRPRPPDVDVQYLGSFGPRDGQIAVFLDNGDIINARTGDVLKGKFVVQGIGFESVDLGFVEFPNEPSQRLPAGG